MDASAIIATLQPVVPGTSYEAAASVDFPTIYVPADRLVQTCKVLKETPSLRFNVLIEVTAADYYPRDPRFEVVYHLFSLSSKQRIRIKVPLDGKNPELESLTCLWPGANWYEREAWDMFGIKFRNHPELKRILLYEEFEGHPLRKDYPINKRQPLIGPGSKEQTPV